MAWLQNDETAVTGVQSTPRNPLKIGDIAVANRVLLAPMSGITDAPFRRLAATLGAGLVVSEMTASDDLVNGKPMSKLRCEAAGIGTHVVQLAGCQAHWMAEGARLAEANGADVALPRLFADFPGMRLDPEQDAVESGWVFRGMTRMPLTWDA